jgi:hypothetical protein
MFFVILLAAPVRAEILTLYSDNGAMGDKVAACGGTPVCAWSGDPINAVFVGTSTDLSNNPEGYQSFKTYDDSWAGWGIFIDTVTAHPGGLDLSRFVAGGQLRFWIYTPTVNFITFNMQTTSGAKPGPAGFYTTANQWVLISTPVSSFATVAQAQQLYSPFEISENLPGTFYVDDVRYVSSDVTSPSFNVALVNRINSSTTTAVTWSTATAASSWTLADQYIQLSVDPNTTSWGVQIYTNNQNSSPAYTGKVSSSTPVGGLVNASSTSVVLPMAWDAQATSSPTLVAQEPNNCQTGNGLACGWFYMMDHATFGVAGSTTVANGAPYVTVKNDYGIHYSQGTVWNDPNEFGAANPPNDIYLEANFGTAMGGLNYKTTTLTIEFYTP